MGAIIAHKSPGCSMATLLQNGIAGCYDVVKLTMSRTRTETAKTRKTFVGVFSLLTSWDGLK